MSAADYSCEVHIAAPPAAVYDALTTTEGARGWWSTEAVLEAHAGGAARFNWSGGDHVEFRIDRLDAGRAVDWTCTSQRDRNLPQPDEWVGTAPSFRLSPEGSGTRLSLIHHGLRAELDCYGLCSGGWDFFLRRSLKGWVEEGAGLPYAP